eukprot:12930678-Prorocentrum_lima.AAC.1
MRRLSRSRRRLSALSARTRSNPDVMPGPLHSARCPLSLRSGLTRARGGCASPWGSSGPTYLPAFSTLGS